MTNEIDSCRRCGGSALRSSGPQPFALPGARAVYAPDRVVEVRHIRVEVDLDFATRSIRGRCTQTIAPLDEQPVTLVLDAVEMVVEEVSLADGGRPAFRHDGRQLRVDLPAGRIGQPIDITIAYRATPRRGLYFLGPDADHPERPVQAWTQGQDEDSRHWFPCFDHPREKATSEVIATVPATMTALSNGRLVAETVEGDRRRCHFRQEVPHSSYLITLVAGEYVAVEDEVDRVALRYLVPPGREEDARRSFARTPEMVRLFARRTGVPYPYSSYAQVVVADFIFGGMENTSATTLTDQTLHDARAHLDYSSETLVAHELAHQWFGDLVTCRDWSQGWLNEGFATFFEYLWKEHAEGRDEADVDRLSDRDAYLAEDGGRYRRPIVTNVFDEPIDLFDHHLYEKGAAVLHMLRHHLGETRFWRAVRRYLQRHRGGAVETRDLARAIDEVTGVNVDRFLEQWVHSPGHPRLEIEHSWDDERRLARVHVKQTQPTADGTPRFSFPLAIRFVSDGREVDRTCEIDGPEQSFYFPLPAAPSMILVDPGDAILKECSEKKPPALWAAQLLSAPLAIDRVRAARSMGSDGDPIYEPALVLALEGDAFWAVRGAAAAALARLRTETSRAALAARASSEPHPKARRQVVRALGELRHDEGAAAALRRVLAGDPSYFVEAEAALSLGKTKVAGVLDDLVQALDRPSHQGVLTAHCLQAMADVRDERIVDLALHYAARRHLPAVRRAAIGLLGVAGDRLPAHRRTAREALCDLLDDPDFRARIAAVEALRSLGDTEALPSLRRAAGADLDGRVRRRAREVLRLLAAGEEARAEVHRMQDEIDKLREETGKLRDQLLKLERR